jgi:hypothetical protein
MIAADRRFGRGITRYGRPRGAPCSLKGLNTPLKCPDYVPDRPSCRQSDSQYAKLS